MTIEEQRAYVKGWQETGRWLDEVRWREVSALDPATAWRYTEELNDIALFVPLPASRWNGSGLFDQQAFFHRVRT